MAVDGSYRISGDAMGTKLEGVLTLVTKGTQLSGSVKIGKQNIELLDPKVKGDTFSCSVVAPTPLGDMKLGLKGTVAGDRVSGTVKTLLVSAPFTGTRI